MRSEALETCEASGFRLRLEFLRRTDRFHHLISLLDAGGQITPLLESIEGAQADPWPASPPLQSLSIETLKEGRRAALLVGMAGASHWSASIEARADDPAFHFDLACRHATRPDWLGSRYQCLAPVEKLTITGQEAIVTQEGETVTIHPATIRESAGTTRWKFTLQLAALLNSAF